MLEYISKDEMNIRIENAIDKAKAIDRNEYQHGIVKGLEIAKDIINDIKIRSTFQGQWLDEKYLIGSNKWIARCSCCHEIVESGEMPSAAYCWCPFCGAKMENAETKKG